MKRACTTLCGVIVWAGPARTLELTRGSMRMQAQANAAHVGVPLWCSNASNGRRALQQTGGFASAGGSGQAQPTVVDMTNSQLEQEMLGGGSHQDASINPGARRAGAGNIAHIEQPAGLNAVVVPQPSTPAKVAGEGVSADGGSVSAAKVKGRKLQQRGSFASGGSSGQKQPTVVDMTNSQLEQEMLGNGPKDASINPGVGRAGIGNIAHIEQPAGVNAVVVPESSTPAKVAGGSVSSGKVSGSAISEGKVKGRRMLGQGGSFSAGGGLGQAQPAVVDMTNSELEREMMGSGPKVAIAAINPGVNGGGGSVGVGSIAHIEQPAGVGAVVVPQPSTPAKVAGGSVSAGKASGSAITAGKLIGRRMLQQGVTGSFAGANAGRAGQSSVAGTNSAAQSGVAVMTNAQLVQAILGNSPHEAGDYNAAAATRHRPH